MENFKFETGGYAYLSKDIIEYATEDHPTFLLGYKGEKVKLIQKVGTTEFEVESPSNPGKPWYCEVSDLMHTKPMYTKYHSTY